MSNIAAATSTTTPATSKKTLRVGLWSAQLALAAAFFLAGLMKTTTPIEELAKMMSVPSKLGAGMTRFIGLSELAGAIGLVVPALTRIKPLLTPIAAAALLLVMVLGAGYHLAEGEPGRLPVNVVLGALAAFVAWGRFRAAPIPPRA